LSTHDNKTRHARFPLFSSSPEVERGKVSLREFHVKIAMARLKTAGAIMGVLLMMAPYPGAALAAPSTFSTTIGPALLCLDQIDPFYFWSYLNQFFGPPYKNEGGAYWFKVQTTLWGAPISDVLVSDGSGQVIFLAAAFTNTKPVALSNAISGNTGIGYTNSEPIQYSPMMSNLGSKIIYFKQDSKIFCSKHNPAYFLSHQK